jgi:hypothetical protein
MRNYSVKNDVHNYFKFQCIQAQTYRKKAEKLQAIATTCRPDFFSTSLPGRLVMTHSRAKVVTSPPKLVTCYRYPPISIINVISFEFFARENRASEEADK